MADPLRLSPALTAEEWVEFGDSEPFFDTLAAGRRPFGPTRRLTGEQKLFALAALALHRHPSGFNQDELAALATAAQFYDRRRAPGDEGIASALHSLSAKLAALLPPAGVRIVPAD